MQKMEIIKELSVFNNIKYYDEPHTYYIDGEKTISCTGFIHKFEEDFESLYFAMVYIAKKYILAKTKQSRDISKISLKLLTSSILK